MKFSSTNRIEAFSDGVIAIIVTLLVLEIKIPEFEEHTLAGFLAVMTPLIPKLIGFAFSFFTVAIFWVNHHNFFHRIKHSSWRLLWHNNLLLFFLALIPFTTGFVGDYPFDRFVVAMYAFNLLLAGLAFSLMWQYALVSTNLSKEKTSLAERKKEYMQSGVYGLSVYGVAFIVALVYAPAALVILVLVQLAYFFMNSKTADSLLDE
ncbi:MAG: TMEM175 family protein [Leptolinea sp.]